MSPVANIVERVARHGQPAISLTDHGLMSGTVQGYKAAKEFGLKFFPGIETYIIDPSIDSSVLETLGEAQRYHLGILGLDLKGYQGLVKLSTKAYTRPRFNRFPRLLVDDLAEFGEEYGEHIAITTGCVFGLLEKTLIDQGPEAASGILRMLQQVTPNLYVEVQKHNIPDDANDMPEDQLIKETIALADQHGLPLITTADSHYLDQKQQPAHSLMKKIAYKNSDGSDFPGDSFHVACFSDDTELLTSKGWVNVADVDLTDCVATIDTSTRAISYINTNKLYKYDYTGKMLDIYQRNGVSMLVTPNHKIWYSKTNSWRRNGDNSLFSVRADQLPFTAAIPQVFNWDSGINPGTRVFKTQTRNGKAKDLVFTPEQWAEYLGWFVSEGNYDHRDYAMVLTQCKPNGVNKIKALLDGVGVNYSYTVKPASAKGIKPLVGENLPQHRFVIYNRNLYDYLIANVGDLAHNKHLPEEVFTWDKHTANVLLEALIAGDGSQNNKITAKNATYYSVSKDLIDDVGRLSIHCGLRPTYIKDGYINGYSKYPCWRLQLSKRKRDTAVGTGTKQMVDYDGKVYCVEVNPHHSLIIRHRGRISMSGNSTGWMKEKWDDDIWSRFEESYADLLSKHDLVIPQLDTFQASVPEMSTSPDADLKSLCVDALNQYGQDSNKEYTDLLLHELDVIAHTKTANYFLLVKQCVDYAKDRHIPIEARGSAAGSLVCFLLGITQVDPIIWGTTFERFLSRDRVGQMPDVDIDVSDVDRGKILEYLSKLEINGVKYKTSQIGTFSHLGQNKDDPNDTGSVFNSYIGYLRKMFMDNAWEEEKKRAEAENRKPVKARADEAGAIAYNSSAARQIKKLEDVKVFRPADYAGLKEIIEMNSVYNSKGTHAGGVLVSGEDVNIDEFIPLMMIPGQKKDTWVTQYTMKDVEQFGLLKMDWLGQTSLSVMKTCQEFMSRENPLDFSWIPNDDPKVIKYVQNMKNYGGLFHLEGYAKGIVAKELQIQNTKDFVLWQAASMPGAVDSGAKDEIVKRRQMKSGNKNYGYTHKILHNIFDETEGYCVFQEQILEVCRSIGMPGEELTSFFKIVKDSGAGSSERNKKRLDDAKPRFYQLARDAGLSAEEVNWTWTQMVAMGSYAFNKAHSASYGIRSYRTAYLKYYYPYEYMGALLYSWAPSNAQVTYKRKKVSKETMYLDMVNQMKLEILPVRVNKSDANWKIETIGDKKFLRRGYLSVKGIGHSAAVKIAQNGPYTDIVDFAERSGVTGGKPFVTAINKTGSRPEKLTGVLNILEQINAFASLDN